LDVVIENETAEEVVSTEDIEVYERSMSPILLDITALLPEEREIDIITEKEDRRSLVRFMSYVFCMFGLIFFFQVSTASICRCISLRPEGCSTSCC
jgi:hypothetical protein